MQRATALRTIDADALQILAGANNGYGAPGETIRYARDASGETTSVVMGARTLTRRLSSASG